MGLFSKLKDKSANKNEAKNELKQKMGESPLIGLIIDEFKGLDKDSFVHIQQNIHDNCHRAVVIGADYFQIKWSTFVVEDSKSVEKVIEDSEYSFSSTGFKPFTSYTSSNGTEFSVDKVVKLFAEVLSEKLAQEFPEFNVSNTIENNANSVEEKLAASAYSSQKYKFSYWVPKQSYKSAF